MCLGFNNMEIGNIENISFSGVVRMDIKLILVKGEREGLV